MLKYTQSEQFNRHNALLLKCYWSDMKPRGGCNGDLALHKDLTVLLGKDKDIDIQIKDIFPS